MNEPTTPADNPNAPMAADSSERVRRPVVALGYQSADGTIVVTDVLCNNFPDITNEEMGALSWKLCQWSDMSKR
jgi:hypothetical protein